MNKLTVAFCDDDAVFRGLLRREAEKTLAGAGLSAVCFEASSAEEFFMAAGHLLFDLIFLDIDMPGMDGIRLGELLRSQSCRSDIVYVSNMEDKVYEIFPVHPWAFIRKSRYAEELPGVLAEYARSRRKTADTLLLTGISGEMLSIDPAGLVYAEAVGKTQKLVFPAAEPLLIRTSMQELEAVLLPHGFIRIHKGFLVNYRFIRKITSRSVLLDTGGDLPVGRDRLSAARERYLALMKWKGLNRPT
ncbi:MAG: LytR/AlgR family response regulator transcription factor [Oscillospiraceae bacterium]